MRSRELKRQVLHVLAQIDIDSVGKGLEVFSPSALVHPLFSALCSVSDMIRWHAVWAFGRVVPRIADQDMEAARVIMRRFLWSLNDESGGIGWGVPEAMAEVMAADSRLADEYLHMLVSYLRDDGPEPFQDGNYIELPMLQRGLLWSIGRLWPVRGRRLAAMGVAVDIPPYLDSVDPLVRGLAVWCLGLMRERSAADMVRELAGDNTEIPIFEDGELWRPTVDELVVEYERRIATVPAGAAATN